MRPETLVTDDVRALARTAPHLSGLLTAIRVRGDVARAQPLNGYHGFVAGSPRPA